MEVDTKDAKFNETFADCRERQGKITNGNPIDPDLTEEVKEETNQSSSNEDDPELNEVIEDETPERPRRTVKPRQYLMQGTISKAEIAISKTQLANLCMETTAEERDMMLSMMDCMESQIDEDTLLTKEL